MQARIEAGRQEPEIKVGNLEARRDLTDVRDTVKAYQLILDRGVPGRPYNVCTGRAISIRDLLDMLLARARTPIRVSADPARYRPSDLPLVVGFEQMEAGALSANASLARAISRAAIAATARGAAASSAITTLGWA
mgnify:CR=1 FL=1